MSDTYYCHPPDYTVLRNKLNLRDARELAFFETEFVMQRIAAGVPKGGFDLEHLKAIHRHLFQDIYEWAGEIRKTPLAKGKSRFMPPGRIAFGMLDIQRRLVEHDFLKGLVAAEFARAAGQIVGDINYLHPFREGNGRTQLLFLEQLARHAGHPIKVTRIERSVWLTASLEAHLGRYEAMSRCIETGFNSNDDDQ